MTISERRTSLTSWQALPALPWPGRIGAPHHRVKVALIVGAAACVAVLLIIRPGDGSKPEVVSIEQRVEQEHLVKVESCQETSPEVMYRCKLETPFRYSGMRKSSDEWCVGPEGNLRVPAAWGTCD